MTNASRINSIFDRIEAGPLAPTWISVLPRERALAQADTEGPLKGLTFAVKDNIDVEGMPTTAACPEFAYQPEVSATVVRQLEESGAVLIGKTNMDQFATGLVGTRTPYGACSSVYNPAYISGGSSSGSAVAVAQGLVDFALGTDTAGSGRVPAAFNGLIGLKPTCGLLSTSGVVPACRTLDCVSIFSKTCATAAAVLAATRRFDPEDPFSRTSRPGEGAAPWLAAGDPFRFGVPAADQMEFFGDTGAAELYTQAVSRLEGLGGTKVEIDFSVFRSAAELLYSGPWVAERLAAIRKFVHHSSGAMDPVVRGIIQGGARFTAVDTFESQYRLKELCAEAEAAWAQMDVLFLPTTGTIYTHEEIASNPVQLNTNLGYYTNFVNLMDLAALAVPAGLRPNGLPFGVTFIGPAFSEEALLALGALFTGESATVPAPTGCVPVAVVGAHLSGQPLNWQLTTRGARLMRAAKTASGYRLYALPGTVPPKPGLVRDPEFTGSGIELEIWAVPTDRFGSFVAEVPAPLGIGTATLDDGQTVKCFICEPFAIPGATEITHFGGWRGYIRSLQTEALKW